MFLAKEAQPLSTLKNLTYEFRQNQDWNSALVPQIQN